MSVIGALHSRLGQEPRRRALAPALAALLPVQARVLDLGCGDGTLANQVVATRADVRMIGADTLTPAGCAIPVVRYDGGRLPFETGTFDVVLLVDVVHHSTHPLDVLAEAGRVARMAVVIKDHLADRVGARPVLRLMDWVGNARHGVALPYNYWTTREWRRAFDQLGWTVTMWRERLKLYPSLLAPFFEAGLHFLAVLRPAPPAGL